MRVAALDLGTNTFLLLIADVRNGRVERVLHDESRVVRLGQGVHESRRLHPEALQRAEECFAHFSKIIQDHQVERTLGCATSAARDATNGHELIQLASRYGIPIEIISGEREATFTFWGTLREPLDRPVLIVDVGGGSTELILGDASGLAVRQSIDVGSVRLTEMFVSGHPIAPIEIARMTGYVQDAFRDVRRNFPTSHQAKLIAVAGTPTTLATIELGLSAESERVDGTTLSLGRLRHWVQRLADMSVPERQALAGMEPKRADVIVAGGLILMLACQCFGARELEVSIRGLRYGVARQLGGDTE